MVTFEPGSCPSPARPKWRTCRKCRRHGGSADAGRGGELNRSVAAIDVQSARLPDAVLAFSGVEAPPQIVNNSLFEPFIVYAIIAVYFAMCYSLSLFSQNLERRMGRGRVNNLALA